MREDEAFRFAEAHMLIGEIPTPRSWTTDSTSRARPPPGSILVAGLEARAGLSRICSIARRFLARLLPARFYFRAVRDGEE
jgi:hypothetical protein